jgi:hypothetical protein
VVEELHRGRAAVADGDREPLRRRLQLGGLLVGQHGRGRLLDDLLVAALYRAVADAERPRGALAVGDQLDLDVPGAGDQALQEHDAAAERAFGLLAGALVGVGELLGVGDDADAAATTARGRLEHQRVADPLGRAQRRVEVGHRAAAPRRDRHAGLLGDQLGADLVAQLAHRLGVGADERHAQLLAQLGERRILGDEAPADPRGVRAGLDQGALQRGQVEVRAVRGASEVVTDVRLAHEGGRGLGVGVQCHRLDLCAALGVELTDGVDEPHRGLSPVDDRDTAEHRTRRLTHTSRVRGFRRHCHNGLLDLCGRVRVRSAKRSVSPNSEQIPAIGSGVRRQRRAARLPSACSRLGTANGPRAA